jgi:hypothetical protein
MASSLAGVPGAFAGSIVDVVGMDILSYSIQTPNLALLRV